jgi:phosphopantothenoylcysteine decarboxylase / phosphopantothenate---cysteine ligase
VNVVLGVSGSISAYRAVDLLRLFLQEGHRVAVVMTAAATRFLPALTLETFAPGRVYHDMFQPGQDPLLHIHLTDACDLLLVAPASADVLGKMAGGIADDLLTTVYLAHAGRTVVAPAMNTRMYAHPAVTANLARLRQAGVEVIEPEVGSLACSVEGRGRLPAPAKIFRYCVEGKP